jgi:hypothetical protein
VIVAKSTKVVLCFITIWQFVQNVYGSFAIPSISTYVVTINRIKQAAKFAAPRMGLYVAISCLSCSWQCSHFPAVDAKWLVS